MSGTVRRRCTTCGGTITTDKGSCRKGHTSWRWSITVDVALPGQPRKQVTRTRGEDGQPFPNKKAAEAAMAKMALSASRGEHVEPSRMTLGEYLTERWMPAVEPNLAPTTFAGYRSMIVNRVLPRLGDVRLQSLDAGTLTKAYSEMLADGGRADDGKGGLSARSVRQTHVIIRKALADGVRWGLVSRNVADQADPPSAKSARAKEFEAWTADELRAFLDHMEGDRMRTVYVLLATTGLRRSEVCGLRWSDVDLDAGRLSVANTRKAIGGRVVEGPPKTAKSRRQISLDAGTVAALREWRKRNLEERMAAGEAWDDSPYVFVDELGRPIHPDRVSKVFDARVAEAGLKRIRLHDLRHTFATLALAAGVPVKVVSDRLGHGSIAITMDVYAHVMPGMDQDAADRVAEAIFGS